MHLQWQPRLPCYFMLTYIRVFHPQYIGNGNPADPLPLYADVYNFWMHACPSPVTVTVTVTISPFKISCTILRRRWLLVNSQSAAASLFCRCSGRRCEQLPCKQHAEQSPLPRRSALDRRPCLHLVDSEGGGKTSLAAFSRVGCYLALYIPSFLLTRVRAFLPM